MYRMQLWVFRELLPLPVLSPLFDELHHLFADLFLHKG